MKIAVVGAIGTYTPADLEHKKESLQAVVRPDTQLDMYCADSGTPYVESALDFYMTEVGVARKIIEVAKKGYDAIVGTAFLDNGLDGARELVDVPVVGPAKVTMYMAATLAHKFAVITAGGALPRHIWAFAKLIGLADRVVAVRTLQCTVADFVRDEEGSVKMLIQMGRRLMDEGAQALVIGCGASTGLAKRVSGELGIPVIDPGVTAVKYAEMLVDLGLTQSRRAFPFNPRVMKMASGG